MVDKKTKARLIQAARKISRWHKPRLDAKKKAQIDKALFLCSSCGTLCYEGKSQVRFFEYSQQYKRYKVVMEPPHMDHIIPVVDPRKGFPLRPDSKEDWNTYFDRMFSDESNFAALCVTCHSAKTAQENAVRKANRPKKTPEKKVKKKRLTKRKR